MGTPSPATHAEPGADLARLRLSVLDRILWLIVILGSFTLIIAGADEIVQGHPALAVFYGALYVAAVVAAFFKGLGYAFRASIILAVLYLLALSDLLLYGMASLMDLVFFAFVMFTGVFFSLRAGICALCGCLLTMGAAALLNAYGGIYAVLPLRPPQFDTLDWLTTASTFALLAVPVLTMLNALLRRLESSLVSTRALVADLRLENAQRERAETAARQSEARFRTIYDGVEDAIFLHDAGTGKIINANRTATEMYGYTSEELLGLSLEALSADEPPYSRSEAEAWLAKAAAGETPVFEWRARNKAGGLFWVEVNMRRARDSGDETIFVAVRDISVRKEQEEDLLHEKRFSEALINALPGLFYLYDGDNNLVRWNRNLETESGYTAVKLKGRNALDWDFREEEKSIKKALAQLASQGHFVVEASLTMKDGRRVPYLFTGTTIERGGERYFLGVGTDLTELKRAEEEMSMLSAAVEQSAESIVVTDVDGIIQYVNPAFETISGYSREEALGRHPRFLRSGGENETLYEELWESLRRGEPWSGRLNSKKKDGTRYTEEVSMSPVRVREGKIIRFVAVRRDITVEVELEQQLRQAQKMEAIGRLAGGVAHDFNNLLQVISGNTALVSEELPENSPVRNELDQVANAATRATALVRQLLAFSRREALRLTPVDINELTSGLLKMIRRIIGEDIDFTFSPGGALPAIEADPSQIEQVVMNLCLNARDAMPEGGELRIVTERVTLGADYCRSHPEVREGEYVMLSVADTGTGVPRDIQEHIFEPFFTTKPLGEGTGLGLSTVYAIAERHGGFIELQSDEGVGAVFKVYIKAAGGKPENATKPRSTLADLSGNGECILLAEDDEHVRALAVTLLTKANYTVITASDGEEAIEVFDRHYDDIDLALLDVVMPGKSGRAVHDHIKSCDPLRPVIFSSGYTHDLLESGQVPDGGYRIIRKPYDLRTLVLAIREALEARERL